MNVKEQTQHVLETYGVTHRRIYHIKHSEGKLETKEENLHRQSLTSFFFNAFLPHGYPDSVSEDYVKYQIWDSVQAFASSITGSICTHAVLKGVGVGDENASAIAATVTWLLKDGVSMVGRITFAWFQGTNLDSDCKKWRLFADGLNDLAMFIDLASVHFQKHFMLMICVSGLMKSIVGVAGGCTRAALTQHQARKNNMADVSAKDGSQETLVNLFALLVSLIILPFVTQSMVLTWIVYVLMASIHLIANYCAVTSVVMETFNESRFHIYTNHYMNEGLQNRKFLTVTEVNQKENLFYMSFFDNFQIKAGSSFKNIIRRRRCEEVKQFLKIYENCDYLLRVSRITSSKTIIYITFSPKATALTQIEAFYQACFVKSLLHHPHLPVIRNLNHILKLHQENMYLEH
ncbi:RUS family member 1-like isoform X2 [Argiope bruennichi]|uniref:RUS family member 1-like isoform X2 n=1 Tax=Argiope bruennichi TaxID=94029 RepID=UPI002493E2AD|nr:RUS family member 1-like isoform X2 [Argiope bruennichi]